MDKHPPLSWLKDRATGILLHPTSLPGRQGIGVLGDEARAFVDFLEAGSIRYWQVLPLGLTGYGDSPYQSFSAFAGNPYLIDLQPLLEYGIVTPSDLEILHALPRDRVDFGSLYRIKWPLLRLIHKNFRTQKRAYLPNYGLYSDFLETHAHWLEPFCAFMALKERFNGAFWGEWPESCREYGRARDSIYWKETAQARDAHAFFQYLFFGQWNLLKSYANEAGIEIIGDAPIFVALDSADVWASPEWFRMSVPGEPDAVAGVPPDYFSPEGQLWGNPLYDWKSLKADGYRWWINRLKANFNTFDVVRLDHFRGFYDFWEIPSGAKTARSGKWVDGPREDFFKAVASSLPEVRIIAEDLGDIDSHVRDFRDRLGLPGMAILQFAFGGDADNLYLPHNLTEASVLYPGTHDNNTSRGWYEAASPAERDHVRRYLRVNGDDIAWDLIRAACASVSRLAVIPMQDILALDGTCRMNTPGTEQGNWQWRMLPGQFEDHAALAAYLAELGALFGRDGFRNSAPQDSSGS